MWQWSEKAKLSCVWFCCAQMRCHIARRKPIQPHSFLFPHCKCHCQVFSSIILHFTSQWQLWNLAPVFHRLKAKWVFESSSKCTTETRLRTTKLISYSICHCHHLSMGFEPLQLETKATQLRVCLSCAPTGPRENIFWGLLVYFTAKATLVSCRVWTSRACVLHAFLNWVMFSLQRPFRKCGMFTNHNEER